MTEAGLEHDPMNEAEEDSFVAKVGGANISRLDLVRDYINHQKAEGKEIYLVVSAFEKVTDILVEAYKKCRTQGYAEEFFAQTKLKHEQIISFYITNPDYTRGAWTHYEAEIERIRQAFSNTEMTEAQRRDFVTGAGERMSAGITQIYLEQEGLAASFIGDVKAKEGIEDHHESMREGLKEALVSQVRAGVITIVGGHIQTKKGAPRGYSDYTGVLAAAVLAEIKNQRTATLHLLKNVDGICTTNPDDLPESEKGQIRHIDELSRVEALQLAAASDDGKEVVQLDALKAAEREDRVDLRVRNIASPKQIGTLIRKEKESNGRPFEVIASQQKLESVVIEGAGMIGESGYASIATDAFTRQDLSYSINLETGTRLCYTFRVPRDEDKIQEQEEKIRIALAEVEEKMKQKNDKIKVFQVKDLATVSVVGDGINGGLSGMIESILSFESIEIQGMSQIKKGGVIPYLIAENDREKAVASIHRFFFGNNKKYRTLVLKTAQKKALALLARF